MPGTSAGLKKAWETRRAKYGPSGRAPQTLPKSSKKGSGAQSGDRSSTPSSTPKSSRNTNRQTRTSTRINGVEITLSHELQQARQEREEVLKAIRAYDRARSSGKRAPRGYEYIDQMRAEAHQKNVRKLRRLDDEIAQREAAAVKQKHQAHGRRYH